MEATTAAIADRMNFYVSEEQVLEIAKAMAQDRELRLAFEKLVEGEYQRLSEDKR